MSRLLDPLHRRHLKALGVSPGWRCLEVGAGNGSVSVWLAGKVAPDGLAVATDLDTRFLEELAAPCLEVRRLDIVQDTVEANAYDMVTARAILHHLPQRAEALRKMAAAVRPGGWLLLIEPDFLPVRAAEPAEVRLFWDGWLAWASDAGIDYFIGRRLPGQLAALGLEAVGAAGEVALVRGGSDWAEYWRESIQELQPAMLRSGHVTPDQLPGMYAALADPAYWTMVCSFTAAWGRKPPT
jgi:SAM-dependent methyltransferase